MRYRVIVQSGYMPERYVEIYLWLPIRREKRAVLGWILIDIHLHVESLLDLRDRGVDKYDEAISRRVGYRETVSLSKTHHLFVVFSCRAELVGESSYSEKPAIT